MTRSHELQRRLQRHFLLCSALPGAAVYLNGQEAAEAAITLVTPGAPISIPQTTAGTYVNLQTQAFGTPAATPGWDINPWGSGASLNLAWFTDTSVGTGNTIASSAVTGGLVQSVPLNSDFTTLTYDPAGYNLQSSAPILAGGTHYIAVQFEDGTAAINNAWIKITTTAGTGFPATIDQWAYAPVGEAFLVGQTAAVPEASAPALGLLALGAAGMRRRRRTA
jgi:MYXO-CTERM domain-containing protein